MTETTTTMMMMMTKMMMMMVVRAEPVDALAKEAARILGAFVRVDTLASFLVIIAVVLLPDNLNVDCFYRDVYNERECWMEMDCYQNESWVALARVGSCRVQTITVPADRRCQI